MRRMSFPAAFGLLVFLASASGGQTVYCGQEAYSSLYVAGSLTEEKTPCAVVYSATNGRDELVGETELADPKTPAGGNTPSTRFTFDKLTVKARDITCRRVRIGDRSEIVPCRPAKMLVEKAGKRVWRVGDTALARPTAAPGYAAVDPFHTKVTITELTRCWAVRWEKPDSESFYPSMILPSDVKVLRGRKARAGAAVKRAVSCECDSGEERFQQGKILGAVDCVIATPTDPHGVQSTALAFGNDWLLDVADFPK